MDFSEITSIKSVREIIHDHVRRAILDGEVEEGNRLIEEDLAERFGVSRTPVREALRQLEAEGLVEYIPRKGVVAKPLTDDDVMEIYSIRQALEALAVYWSAERITPNEIDNLRILISRMRNLTEEGKVDELIEVTARFTELLIEACKMPRLVKLISTYQEYLRQFRQQSMQNAERRRRALGEHEEIFNAVCNGESELARRLMVEHLQGAFESYLDSKELEE